MAKRSETKNEFFEDLRAGLTAAIDHAQGKRMDLRTTMRSLPRPPKEMSSKEITGIRIRLNVSQGVFARALNISPKTVQSWEQGIGRPSGASLKLLSIAGRDPSILFDQPVGRALSRSVTQKSARSTVTVSRTERIQNPVTGRMKSVSKKK